MSPGVPVKKRSRAVPIDVRIGVSPSLRAALDELAAARAAQTRVDLDELAQLGHVLAKVDTAFRSLLPVLRTLEGQAAEVARLACAAASEELEGVVEGLAKRITRIRQAEDALGQAYGERLAETRGQGVTKQ